MSNNRNVNKKLARKEAKEQAERQRRKDLFYACLVAVLAIATVLVLTVHPDYVHLEPERETASDGETVVRFHDREHGVTYLAAPPFVYEPVTYIEKPYAKYDGCYLYPIDGVEPTQYLAYEITEGIYDLYYNEELTLPTLLDDVWSGIGVCIDNSERPTGLFTVEDAKKIQTVREEILRGKEATIPMGEIDGIYNLRFRSQTYPFLYYCVKFITTKTSGCFYYDYVNEVYYEAGDVIDDCLREYYEDLVAETTA